MDLHPTYITGKITLSDGSETEFSITAEVGWQQWGNIPEKLGDTVDLMDALADAACDHGLADERDSDDEPDFEPSPDPGWMNP
jgi:hypothetical protein